MVSVIHNLLLRHAHIVFNKITFYIVHLHINKHMNKAKKDSFSKELKANMKGINRGIKLDTIVILFNT